MFKLTGIFLILTADFFIVKFILDKKTRELSFLRDCISFLKNISIEIIDFKKPLYEAIVMNKTAVSCEIDELIDKFTLKNASPREGITDAVNDNSILDNSAKKVITEYLNIVGRTTKEGMGDYLSVTIKSLEYIISEKTEKIKTTKKTVNATVYSLSVLFVILII